MLKLTSEEKKDLKELFKKPGFKVMDKISEDFELDVLRQLKLVDTSNAKHLEILAKNTQYLKGVEDFMKTIKTQNNCVSLRKDPEE